MPPELSTLPTPELDCPRCINERLVRAIGNLLVCPNCDVTFIEKRYVNNWLDGKVQVINETDLT